MTKKQQETTDEIDELMDWMVDVFSNPDQQSEPANPNNSLTVDLTQVEVGMTRNRIDYATDGKNWKWFS